MRAVAKVVDGKNPISAPVCAADLVTLAGIDDRHPKALTHELLRAPLMVLTQLAYGEHADPAFHGKAPDWLASAAYDEIERRQGALSRLLADCPGIMQISKGEEA